MKSRIIYILIIVIVSCSDEKPVVPVTPIDEKLSIKGKVLNVEDQSTVVPNVKVIFNDSFTFSDSTGFFELTNIKEGKVQIKFEHELYSVLDTTIMLYENLSVNIYLSKLNIKNYEWISFPPNLIADQLYERENDIWFSGDGLTRMNKTTGEIKTFNSSNSVLIDRIGRTLKVESFVIDSEGNILIVWQCKLLKFMNNTLTTIESQCGFDTASTFNIMSVGVDKNNVVWSGWENRLQSRDDGSFNYYEIRETNLSGSDSFAYIDVITFEDSTNWLGSSSGGGICHFINENNYTIYNTTNSDLPDGMIHDIAIDLNGVKWIATFNGLAKFYGDVWQVFNTSNSLLSSNNITAISIDSDNTPWVGTKNGLYHIDSEWTCYDSENSNFLSDEINDVLIDDKNNVWVTTDDKRFYKLERPIL